MLVQCDHFFKDIISTATQTCLSKLCLQWIVQFLVKDNHLKYKNYASFSLLTSLDYLKYSKRIKLNAYFMIMNMY